MPALPLFESALLIPAARPAPGSEQPLIPPRALAPGEQYRFHFDMSKCIGCKCCVVACNEQNGNPAEINWRTVGEIEGGHYPSVQRFHLSMGCNHCLEPSCLTGCPVEAYTKDPVTGIVLHSAEACIGCQYCTWNCSYGVPQYNPERGVVGKCDMCHNRLRDAMAPACAEACPERAISIEIVNIAEWRRDFESANAPGLPSAADSLSTTRITLPASLRPDTDRIDTQHIGLQHAHPSLVFMLVLTQLSSGAFAILWALSFFSGLTALRPSALSSFLIGCAGLAASISHLGRPAYAWRALKAVRRSWVSREVVAFSLFILLGALYVTSLLFSFPFVAVAGLGAVLAGAAGTFSSARIYMVRARPAWNSSYTLCDFFLTGALLGSLFVNTFGPHNTWINCAPVTSAAIQLAAQVFRLLWLARADSFELRATALLLCGRLRRLFLLRIAILIAGGIVLPITSHSGVLIPLAFALALMGELAGRYLFFVSVVPKSQASAFVSARRAA